MSLQRDPISRKPPSKEKLPESEGEVVWETDVRKKSAQDKLIDLEPPKPKKKRGPGRPRKRPPTPPPELSKPAEQIAQSIPEVPLGDEEKASIKTKVGLVRKIELLKTKLGAVGSGMIPDASMSEAMLEAEVAQLNQEIDMRRGNGVLEQIIKVSLPPMIEQGAAMLDPEKATVDLDGYKEEVANNWDDLFKDAVAQLSIMYGDWFSVGPLATVGKGLAECAVSTNAKNSARKAFIMARAQQEAMARRQGMGTADEADSESDPDADVDDKV